MPPPRLALFASKASKPLERCSRKYYSSSCSICRRLVASNCSTSCRSKQTGKYSQRVHGARRHITNTSGVGIESLITSSSTSDYRSKLKAALLDLQKHSQSYVNISRLQLALRGLEQTTGEETIRVAILGLAGQGDTSQKARELVRLLLADPLKEEEEWERTLVTASDISKPLLLRIGENTQDEGTSYGLGNRLVQELKISCPSLNNHHLEILVLESDILAVAAEQSDVGSSILVPTVEIPTSSTGRYTPVTTPVHKALVLGDGILGAASLINFAPELDSQIILQSADLPSYTNGDAGLPLQITDIALANTGLALFRKSLGNAMAYERDWFKSGLPEILGWLKDGTLDNPSGRLMKTPVRHLIQSVLIDVNRRIEEEESYQLSRLSASKVEPSDLNSLRQGLAMWAERAHTELRDQLDIAFRGGRWRKLGWWKLFWRVDDVSMIASDILNQRFLTGAEKEIIYLAGKIEQAGIFDSFPKAEEMNWAFKSVPSPPSSNTLGSTPGPLYMEDLLDTPQDEIGMIVKKRPWPLHIPIARSYLSQDTVLALQALAQKLVLQTLTTSGFTSVFAGLIYMSTLSTTLYETGAIAALGIVWSLRRMQNRWETARSFWEDEVREEGRKAVRGTEGIVTEVLSKPTSGPVEGHEELQRAKKAVEEAQLALDEAGGNAESEENVS